MQCRPTENVDFVNGKSKFSRCCQDSVKSSIKITRNSCWNSSQWPCSGQLRCFDIVAREPYYSTTWNAHNRLDFMTYHSAKKPV